MLSKLLKGSEPPSASIAPWRDVPPAAPQAYGAGRPGNPGFASASDSSEVEAALKAKLAAAQAEIDRRVREAQENGFRQGEAAGKKAVQAQVQTLLEKLAAAIGQLAEYRPRLRADAESDMVRLAVAIARRVLNRELSVDRESITGIIRIGLEKLRAQESARARVHPEFAAPIREYLARSGVERIEVTGDAGLDRGAVVFETTRGDLDLSVETQLREIEGGLADRFEKRPR